MINIVEIVSMYWLYRARATETSLMMVTWTFSFLGLTYYCFSVSYLVSKRTAQGHSLNWPAFIILYRPQRSWGKAMFLHVPVILFMGGGGIPACIAGGIPACLAAGLWCGGIPACLAGFQAHTQGWSCLGGVVSQHALYVSRPTPRGEVEGSGGGDLQAHTQGFSRPTPGGSPGPHPGGSPGPHPGGLQAYTQGGLQAHTWGVSKPTPRGVCIPACTEADPPTIFVDLKIESHN